LKYTCDMYHKSDNDNRPIAWRLITEMRRMTEAECNNEIFDIELGNNQFIKQSVG